jgi:hypothetical protein
MKSLIIIVILFFNFTSSVFSSESLKSRTGANEKVYFIAPTDGQTVSQTFVVVFGLSGMGVAPAGVQVKNTGHHHLLIDTEKLPNMNQPLAGTEKIKHFGGGQTQTELTLSPGTHTLQLLLGNHMHIPHKPPILSQKITIIVER